METVLWLGGLATAAMAIWKALIPAARSIVAMHALLEAQLRANGGGSLVDRVARTDTAVAANTATLTGLKEGMAGLNERVARIEERLHGREVA